jgi:hypothetical protein
VAADFAGIALSHREAVACGATRGEADHHHATTQEADQQDAPLSMVASVVTDPHRGVIKDFPSTLEAQATLNERLRSLRRVIRDQHVVNVYTFLSAATNTGWQFSGFGPCRRCQ